MPWILKIGFWRRNQLHSEVGKKTSRERFTTVRSIADYSLKFRFNWNRSHRIFRKLDLMRRSTVHGDPYWEAVTIRDGHPFRSFAALCFADGLSPFLADAKLPSIKPSAQSIRPFRSSSRIRRRQALSKEPSFAHAWKRRWQVDLAGYFAGNSFHGAPVLKIHKIPLRISRSEALGRPLPSTLFVGVLKNRRMCFHSLLVKSIANPGYEKLRRDCFGPSGLAKTRI